MRKKIFRSLMLVSMMIMLLSSVISTTFLHSYFNNEQSDKLHIELELVADAVNEIGTSYLDYVDNDTYRFTVVNTDGSVIYDTKADTNILESHADREEIIEAFESGNGNSARYSSTLTEKTFYEAVKLSNGTVLRVSVSQLTLSGAFLRVLPMNLLIAMIAMALSFLVSNRMSRVITEPLLTLDLEHPADNNTYEELSPVLAKIRRQHRQIKEQMLELAEKNSEFSQIISSMSEGLVLLNKQGLVIAMNSSAKNIFGIKDNPEGTDFITLEPSAELNRTIDAVKFDAHSEAIISKNGREYQFNISRIESDGQAVGTLILAFDITEKAFAERNRQEFTANVSHELKTPLQSIIGSAELLENGLVKPEDTSRFVGNIKNEATRLVCLINDIIRLSQLDEKAEPTKELIEMTAVVNEVVEVLTPSAAKKNVTLSLDCSNTEINGVRRYIYEIIYNLCDNAIRYNNAGGKVDVSVKKLGKDTVITVADTGIGIPIDHQARIFERFYRVDKSHSKETGGTGLGLSIVKRAVMLHNGTVELNSSTNEGTTVKVILPEEQSTFGARFAIK